MAFEHTTKAFDSELQELTRLVAEMGGLAERQIVDSVDALIRRYAPVDDPMTRQRFAQLYIEQRLIALNNQRAAALARAGTGSVRPPCGRI